jgi:hypothetical protein
VRSIAEQSTGEIVTGSLLNGIENRNAVGKVRPILLVERRGGNWLAVCFTTREYPRGGGRRHAIPDPDAVGLDGPSFIWGARISRISPLDLYDHLGWADDALVEEVLATVSMGTPDRLALRKYQRLIRRASCQETQAS